MHVKAPSVSDSLRKPLRHSPRLQPELRLRPLPPEPPPSLQLPSAAPGWPAGWKSSWQPQTRSRRRRRRRSKRRWTNPWPWHKKLWGGSGGRWCWALSSSRQWWYLHTGRRQTMGMCWNVELLMALWHNEICIFVSLLSLVFNDHTLMRKKVLLTCNVLQIEVIRLLFFTFFVYLYLYFFFFFFKSNCTFT